ncbi:MAG: hypothetical protein H6Q59_1424 [Firmicutes bacterium]|nr:hypothetical protein [Bacillota bacterium]
MKVLKVSIREGKLSDWISAIVIDFEWKGLMGADDE